ATPAALRRWQGGGHESGGRRSCRQRDRYRIRAIAGRWRRPRTRSSRADRRKDFAPPRGTAERTPPLQRVLLADPRSDASRRSAWWESLATGFPPSRGGGLAVGAGLGRGRRSRRDRDLDRAATAGRRRGGGPAYPASGRL
ncbi:MAG: hypothetical protein AVDCRST_MAG59-677, partial [uncultured Thermomicrobiales bacterium]